MLSSRSILLFIAKVRGSGRVLFLPQYGHLNCLCFYVQIKTEFMAMVIIPPMALPFTIAVLMKNNLESSQSLD